MDSERFLYSAQDDWKRSLLQAAASEAAPEGVRDQVLGALERLGPSAAPPTLGTQLARLEGGVATKLALALLIAAGAPAAYWLATRGTESVRVTASEPPFAPAPAAPATLLPIPLSAPLPAPTPPPDALATPSPQIASRAPRPIPRPTLESRPRPKPLAPMTADPLSAELRLLTSARSQLQSGSAAAAQQTLERYRRTFPRGVLGPEAEQLEQRARALAVEER